jgi:hypothetical protein
MSSDKAKTSTLSRRLLFVEQSEDTIILANSSNAFNQNGECVSQILQASCPACQTMLQFQRPKSTSSQVQMTCPKCSTQFACSLNAQLANRTVPSPAPKLAAPVPQETNHAHSSVAHLSDAWQGQTTPWQRPAARKRKAKHVGKTVAAVGALCLLASLGLVINWQWNNIAALVDRLPSSDSPEQILQSQVALAEGNQIISMLTSDELKRTKRIPRILIDQVRRSAKTGFLESSESDEKRREMLKESLERYKTLTKDLASKRPSIPLTNDNPKTEEDHQTNDAIGGAFSAFLATDFYIQAVAESPTQNLTDIEKQIQRESRIKMKAAKVLAQIDSTSQADGRIQEIQNIAAELKQSYVDRPKIKIMYKASKEVTNEFTAADVLYSILADEIEKHMSPSKEFLQSLYHFEETTELTDYRDSFGGMNGMARRINNRNQRQRNVERDEQRKLAEAKQKEKDAMAAAELAAQNKANAEAQQSRSDRLAADNSKGGGPGSSGPGFPRGLPSGLAQRLSSSGSMNPASGPMVTPPSVPGGPFGPFGPPGAPMPTIPNLDSFKGSDSVRIIITNPGNFDSREFGKRLQATVNSKSMTMNSNAAEVRIGFSYSGDLQPVVDLLSPIPDDKIYVDAQQRLIEVKL